MDTMLIAQQLRALADSGHPEAEALCAEADRVEAVLQWWMDEGTKEAVEALLEANSSAHRLYRKHSPSVLPAIGIPHPRAKPTSQG